MTRKFRAIPGRPPEILFLKNFRDRPGIARNFRILPRAYFFLNSRKSILQ
jgi:hypothetical protein